MYCPSCGTMQHSGATECGACGAAMPRGRVDTQQQSTELMGHFLPVNVSVWGVLAGYLGLLSVLIFPLAPFSILCSVMTLRDLKKNPRHYGMSRAIVGFIGGVIGLAVGTLVIIGMLSSEDGYYG